MNIYVYTYIYRDILEIGAEWKTKRGHIICLLYISETFSPLSCTHLPKDFHFTEAQRSTDVRTKEKEKSVDEKESKKKEKKRKKKKTGTFFYDENCIV